MNNNLHTNLSAWLIALITILLITSCKTEPKSDTSQRLDKAPSSIQLRLKSEPDGLSPIVARHGVSRQVYRHLFVRLLEVDPMTLNYIPQLATKQATSEILDNGDKKFTFDIHPNAQWSDGRPLTVADILFSYKILKHPGVKTRYGVIADLIKEIDIQENNSTTISFTADECHISLESSICEMFIYPEHIFDPEKIMRDVAYVDFKEKEKIASLVSENPKLAEVGERFMDVSYFRDPNKFITAGAYTFKEWLTGQRVVIQKNKNWWGNAIDSPIFINRPEEIQFQIIPDNTTAMTQLANGELDAISDVTAELFEEYKSKENLSAHVVPALQTIWLTLNTKKGLLSDKLVRKALAYSCDEQSIIDIARKGYGKIVTGPFMPGTAEYNDKVKPIGYDIQKAITLLKEAGWADSDQDGIVDKMINGKKTNLSLEFVMSSKSTTGPVIGELFKNSAKKAGIDIRIQAKDRKVYGQDQKAGNFDMVLQGTSFNPGLYDPKGRWHTESFPPNGLNHCRFGDEETDKIIDQLRSECEDAGLRTDLYHRLHAKIAEEQPVLFLYNTQYLYLINKKFDNVVLSPNRPGLYEEFLTLK